MRPVAGLKRPHRFIVLFFCTMQPVLTTSPGQKPCPAVWPNPPLSSVLPATPSPPPHSDFPAPAPNSQVQKQLELVNRLSANWGWKILYQSQWSGGMEQLRVKGGGGVWEDDGAGQGWRAMGANAKCAGQTNKWMQFCLLGTHFSSLGTSYINKARKGSYICR